MTKTLIVCGYGPGISTSVAEKLGAEGFSIALVARNAEKLQNGVRALEAKGIKAAAITADLTNPTDARAVVAKRAVRSARSRAALERLRDRRRQPARCRRRRRSRRAQLENDIKDKGFEVVSERLTDQGLDVVVSQYRKRVDEKGSVRALVVWRRSSPTEVSTYVDNDYNGDDPDTKAVIDSAVEACARTLSDLLGPDQVRTEKGTAKRSLFY